MSSLLLIFALFDTSTFVVSYPAYEYRGSFSRAHAIDFRNMPWHSDYEWDTSFGNTNEEGIGQVYDLRQGNLRLAQEIDWQIVSLRSYLVSKNERLVIRAAHYLDGDARCCISATDIVTFRWNGSRFLQASIRTELSKEAKQEGKVLR